MRSNSLKRERFTKRTDADLPGFKAQMRLVRTQDFPTSRLEGARQSLVIVVVRLRFRIEQEAD